MRAIRAGPTSGSAGARSSDAGGSNAKSGLGTRGHSCKEEQLAQVHLGPYGLQHHLGAGRPLARTGPRLRRGHEGRTSP